MASIKHWCISPTSQKEQKPPRCTRQWFIYLFIFVSVSVRFSHLCCNQILYYPLAADFLAHSKKRLCNRSSSQHLCTSAACCIWTVHGDVWVQQCFFFFLKSQLDLVEASLRVLFYVEGERRISVYLWWVEFFSSQVCCCYRCCSVCTVVALCK